MASSVTAVTSVIPSAFKKSTAATPSGPNKRKIASVIVDQENMASSPPAATAAVTKTPINNSVVKKVFTGANVAVSALNNQTNIINNQQPKARVSQKSQQIPKSAPIIDPSTAETLPPKTGKAVLPQAVARRNARERNRVKQVNNGFAALRQHIPEEMAEAFEKGAPASGQLNSAAQKKLSKVETLRMAVEYIRNLEGLLNISSGNPVAEHSFSFCDTSSLVSNSPSSPSFSNSSMIDEESLHLPHNSQPQQLLGYEESPVIDQSRIVLPSVTTINGIPYLSQGFLQPNGEFVVVTGNGQSGDEEEQQQQLHHHQPPQQFMYQSAGVDPQQQIILYAPLVESDFQSNFVNNNLLAPAFQGAPLPATAAVGTARNSGGGGQSPVPDGDQIKIEQEPSRGGPSPHSYENKSPLIRHVPCDEREESPPKRLCSSNEQFSVVDQSGVIIRGNFIEIKQEQFLQQQQQPQPSPGSDDLLTPTAESMYDNWQDRLVHMKTEIRDDEEAGLGLLESDMMIDAMEWWENEKRSA